MDIFALAVTYGAWSWLIAGLILLALELLLPGGVFVWLGTAAILTALTRFIFVFDWPLQIGLFGVLGIVALVIWLRVVRARGNGTDKPLLNRRAERHVGEEVLLNEPISGGVGRVPIGDTLWRVAGPDLPAGRKVKIIGHDGPVLRVQEVTP